MFNNYVHLYREDTDYSFKVALYVNGSEARKIAWDSIKELRKKGFKVLTLNNSTTSEYYFTAKYTDFNRSSISQLKSCYLDLLEFDISVKCLLKDIEFSADLI